MPKQKMISQKAARLAFSALRALASNYEIRSAWDEGPMYEGWQSDELRKAWAEADEAIALVDGKKS